MISWIQITFQRHFRILFFALLVVLIISFVFTIGAPGIGSGDRQVQARTFFDLNLSSPEDQAKLYGDANLSVFLQFGQQQNISSAQIQEFALQRYAALHVANQFNLPGPDETKKTEFIRGLPAFGGANGEFDASVYASFRDNLKIAGQFTEADVNRVIIDDFRADAARTLLGGPGYVEDSEVAFQLSRSETVWSTDIAQVDYASYAPTIEPTDDQLQSYFESNAFRYETAPQVRVDYVEVPATRYLAEITLSDAEIRAFYDANPARYPAPAKPEGTEAAPVVGDVDPLDADFLAVKDQVSASMRFDRARRLAADAASDLTVALFDAKLSADAYGKFLSDRGMTLRSGAPFSVQSPPQFLSGSPQLARQAFSLTAQKPLSDPLSTATAAVVLIWRESIPSGPSMFNDVADKVRADFVDNEKRKKFVELGRQIRTDLEQKVTAGTVFADAVKAVAESTATTIDILSFSEFTGRTPPANLPYAAANALEQLDAGDISEMVIANNKGIITYASAKVAPVTDNTNPRFAELKQQIATYNSASTAAATLQSLIASELGIKDTE
jgi:peptidyl-prolyl cis-trans isomerase D